MKAAVFIEPGKVEIQDLPKPTIQEPTDALSAWCAPACADLTCGGSVVFQKDRTTHRLVTKPLV